MKRLLLILLFAGSLHAGQVTLAWNESAGASGYRVYWGTRSGEYTKVLDARQGTVSTVTGLVNTKAYYFAVTAYSEAGESGFSNEVWLPPLAHRRWFATPEVVGGQVRLTIFSPSVPVVYYSDDLISWCALDVSAIQVRPGEYQLFDPLGAQRYYKLQ